MRYLLLTVALAAAASLSSIAFAATPASTAEVARYAEQLLTSVYAEQGPGAALLVARRRGAVPRPGGWGRRGHCVSCAAVGGSRQG